jgi:hypothetical protein
VNPGAAIRGVLGLLQGFEGKGPDVVLGNYASSGTKSAQQVLQTRGIPQLSPMSTATELKALQALFPTLFRMAPTNDLSAQAVADVRSAPRSPPPPSLPPYTPSRSSSRRSTSQTSASWVSRTTCTPLGAELTSC